MISELQEVRVLIQLQVESKNLPPIILCLNFLIHFLEQLRVSTDPGVTR